MILSPDDCIRLRVAVEEHSQRYWTNDFIESKYTSLLDTVADLQQQLAEAQAEQGRLGIELVTTLSTKLRLETELLDAQGQVAGAYLAASVIAERYTDMGIPLNTARNRVLDLTPADAKQAQALLIAEAVALEAIRWMAGHICDNSRTCPDCEHYKEVIATRDALRAGRQG